MPPQVALYHLAIGHYFTAALRAVARLGVADHLAGDARSAEDLARATGTQADALRRVLRLLATAGVFEERTDGSFALTALGECLRSGVPGSARAMVLLFAGDRIQQAWSDLEYCLRTGEPAYRKRGLDGPFSDPDRSPEEQAAFDAAMADITRLTAVAVAAAYDFGPVRTVADVGGGNGALLIGILQAHPHLRGVILDLPPAAARARSYIAEQGLGDRCEAVGGNFFEAVPAGADLYLLKHVIHDWDDDRAAAILTNCRRAMPANGRLAIVEGVYQPRRRRQRRQHAGEHGRPPAVGGAVPRALPRRRLPAGAHPADERAGQRDRGCARLTVSGGARDACRRRWPAPSGQGPSFPSPCRRP